MRTTSKLAIIPVVMLFAAGVAFLIFYAPGLCTEDAARDGIDHGSQDFTINHARITVVSITGSSVNCTCRNRKMTFIVENHLKRRQLLPGRSYEVDYAATRYPDGTEGYVISKIYHP